MRDNHLKKEEYFNTAKYPAINFTSTKITGDAMVTRYQGN
jgi:polyisoprenoid-binding protein YceI